MINKPIFLFFILFFLSSLIFSQVDTLVSIEYSNLNSQPRVENDGIYFLSSIEYQKSNLTLNTLNKYKMSFDLLSESKSFYSEYSEQMNTRRRIKTAEVYNGNNSETISITGTKSEINVLVKDNNITITSLRPLLNNSFSLPQDIDYADFVGVSSDNNFYFITEVITRTSPLDCKRFIDIFSSNGKLLNQFEIPNRKYFELPDDLVLNDNGNIVQIVSDEQAIHVIEYKNSIQYKNNKNIESTFGGTLHYNLLTGKQTEPVTFAMPESKASSRFTALKRGESYVYHQYYCTAKNISKNNVTAPDGDVVRTPGWLVEGWNAGVPYKWGGFHTLNFFDTALRAGYYAGDINTAGVTSYATGVDCSGFVSKCWQLSSHYATSMMPSISTQYTYWSDLRPGDAILRQGHVRLFTGHMSNGEMRVVESTSRHWDVTYWSFAPSELLEYDPVYYNNMSYDINVDEPKIIECKFVTEDSLYVKWKSNTEGLSHFNLYASHDLTSWNTIEFDSDTNFVTLPYNQKYGFFRLTSFDYNYQESESFQSNVVACGKGDAGYTVALVDGFDRKNNSASFQASNHNFLQRYGKYFSDKGVQFYSIHSSQLNESNNATDAIFWIVGDQSTGIGSLNDANQSFLRNYLDSGNSLFICGSEIGWDLYERGSDTDKDFYNNYLKANFEGDNASSNIAKGVGSLFSGIKLNFGQFYIEDYPDKISPYGNSELCFNYSTNYGAGVIFEGTFGNGTENGKLLYLAFPLETAADDEMFTETLNKTSLFFQDSLTSVKEDLGEQNFTLYQNYPNPFNPSTTLSFYLEQGSKVNISVYNLLGENVATIYNNYLNAGNHKFKFNATGISSGIYLAKFSINDKLFTQKICLIK